MEAPTHHRAVALLLTLVLGLGIGGIFRRSRASPSPTAPPLAASPLPSGSPSPSSAPHDARAPERIDPNVASAGELQRLPGIGPALARRIVAAREAGAVFRRPEDLTQVRGIGPRTVQRLADHLRFAPRDAGAL